MRRLGARPEVEHRTPQVLKKFQYRVVMLDTRHVELCATDLESPFKCLVPEGFCSTYPILNSVVSKGYLRVPLQDMQGRGDWVNLTATGESVGMNNAQFIAQILYSHVFLERHNSKQHSMDS